MHIPLERWCEGVGFSINVGAASEAFCRESVCCNYIGIVDLMSEASSLERSHEVDLSI